MAIMNNDPKVPDEEFSGKSPVPSEFNVLLNVSTKGYKTKSGSEGRKRASATAQQPPVSYDSILNVGEPRVYGKGGLSTPTTVLGKPSPNPYKGAK